MIYIYLPAHPGGINRGTGSILIYPDGKVLDDFCDSHGRQMESFVECSVPGQFTGELNLLLGNL